MLRGTGNATPPGVPRRGVLTSARAPARPEPRLMGIASSNRLRARRGPDLSDRDAA